MGNRTLRLTQAAALLGLAPRRVRQLCQQGVLQRTARGVVRAADVRREAERRARQRVRSLEDRLVRLHRAGLVNVRAILAQLERGEP
jgi:hypothetical protein